MAVLLNRAVNAAAIFPIFAILIVFSLSCGGSGGPTAPGAVMTDPVLSLPNERNARTPESLENHFSMGMYQMMLDPENQTIEVLENRDLAMHFDIKNLLLNPNFCPPLNCLRLQFLEIDEDNDLYTIKATVYNPTFINVFDLRLIVFYDEKAHRILNPDDYTRLYSMGDYTSPFRAFNKSADSRTFFGYSSASEIFELSVPDADNKWWIFFAIDCSLPQNCQEPYELENFGYEGDIYPDNPDLGGTDQGEGLIYSEVYDWQENISEVTVDTTPITGNITALEYNSLTERYEASIADSMDTPPGDYRCLLAAYSTDDASIGIFNYITITVNETPPPTVQTIYGHIGDSLFMNGLDVAAISVVNQDPLGFPPGQISVYNGDYVVAVATGVYNISVVPEDISYSPVLCYDVLITEDENVHLDFGLHNPLQEDPYNPYAYDYVNWWDVVSFNGRVVNTLGEPIMGATVELQSDDSWYYGQECIQSDVTDDGGYFNLLNVPRYMEEYSTDWIIYNYRMQIRAPGYNPVGLLLNPVVGVSQYRVIPLTPAPMEVPIYEENFELTSSMTEWVLTGYYHRQNYDPNIVNVAFDPTFPLNALPPDEPGPGSIPLPVSGNYYLWYGVEQDGCFLGVWDPSYQTMYNGGMSDVENSGSAQSPEIDLTDYSSARVEFYMSYSIESQDTPSFEYMRFYVNSGYIDNQIFFFNPFVDPGMAEFAFSQRGFNRTMIWVFYQFDISAYSGGPIKLKWTFSTNDSAYNGYRGQFIDDIRVYAN